MIRSVTYLAMAEFLQSPLQLVPSSLETAAFSATTMRSPERNSLSIYRT